MVRSCFCGWLLLVFVDARSVFMVFALCCGSLSSFVGRCCMLVVVFCVLFVLCVVLV